MALPRGESAWTRCSRRWRGWLSAMGLAVSSSPRGRGASDAIGRVGEDAAAAHVRHLGMSIVARNAIVPMGEADIVAFDPATGSYVIVEVKSRVRENQDASGHVPSTRGRESGPRAGLINITRTKRRTLRAIGTYLATRNGWDQRRVRVDGVGVELLRDAQGRLVAGEIVLVRGIA